MTAPALYFCRFRVRSVLFAADVAGQALAVPAVFDGLLGTAADAGHAVGAVVFPDRPAVFYVNVAEGADRSAFAAGDACAGDAELFGVDEQRVEQAVDRPAAQGVRN